VGDVNADGMVDVYDLILVSSAFGSSQTKKEWNPNADINNDNIIDIYDLILVASHFGEANS
jgi:Ca2+-binding EF-hand superfamily protein